MLQKLTVKELRRAKGISLDKMASTCGVHVNTYRAWEEKPSDIKMSKALLIADTLGVSLYDILFTP